MPFLLGVLAFRGACEDETALDDPPESALAPVICVRGGHLAVETFGAIKTVIELFYRISGLTYCVAPIAELNGAASVTLSDLKFTGQLRWTKQKQ